MSQNGRSKEKLDVSSLDISFSSKLRELSTKYLYAQECVKGWEKAKELTAFELVGLMKGSPYENCTLFDSELEIDIDLTTRVTRTLSREKLVSLGVPVKTIEGAIEESTSQPFITVRKKKLCLSH